MLIVSEKQTDFFYLAYFPRKSIVALFRFKRNSIIKYPYFQLQVIDFITCILIVQNVCVPKVIVRQTDGHVEFFCL